MICPKCGHTNDDGNLYCGRCGGKLRKKQGNGGLKVIIVVLCIIIAMQAIRLAENKSASGSSEVPENTVLKEEASGTPVTTQADSKHLDYVDGDWKSVTLRDGSSTLTVHAVAFTQELTRCKKMTVNMDVTMNANTQCKDWQVWGRVGGQFVKLDRISLPNGNGATTQTVTFNPPVTLDAIAVTPTIPGGYSWSMSLYVTDVVLD